MKWYVFLVVFLLASLYGGVANAAPYQSGSFDPVRTDENTWSCYDYSIDYARNNQEWGIVTVSNNPCFYGVSNYVNWKVEDNVLFLYDSQYNVKCVSPIDQQLLTECNEWFRPAYYKFWSVDETPKRNYRRLQDNSVEWLNV